MRNNTARIDIGSSENLSNLDLSFDSNSNVWNENQYKTIFGMNDGEVHSSINFYTSKYTSPTQTINGKTINEIFFGNGPTTTISFTAG
jgi:hypothetical protein